MDFISTALVTIKEPTGFWETILNAFKSATGTYIMAVILIALLVRILFSLVDIINKKVNMKNMNLNAKMKPELEAIQKKYGHDQRLVQQKTNEIYKKYQFSMLGSCFPMLITMVLQLTVFLTLWNSLQAVSNYNIVNQYENMKDLYANVLRLNTNGEFITKLSNIQEEYSLDADVNFETNELIITINYADGTTNPDVSNFTIDNDLTNEDIYELVKTYVPEVQNEETPSEEVSSTAEEEQEPSTELTLPNYDYDDTGFNQVIQELAEKIVEKYYTETQEGFLWIKNIYKAEAPTSPLFTKSEIKDYMSKYYTEDEKIVEDALDYEGIIFDYVVAGVDTSSLGLNGYYILTIIAVATSFLSIWLSNKLMKKKDQAAQPGGKMMYFIMPIIIGIFTFMYTSLFAIYLIIGQIVMIALTPLTTLIVRKWMEADAKKNKDKNVIDVDYRRKDM